MSRYLSGLCAAGLGLCGGGWLIVTAVLLGGAPSDATLVTLATGAGVALVSVVALWCWSLAWRQRMRRDGVLQAARAPSPRQARRSRRALRREMRRTARNRARRGSQQGAQPRQARSARPDTGLAGVGLAGVSIAHLVPGPRAAESQPPSPPLPPRSPAATDRGDERSIPRSIIAEDHPCPPAGTPPPAPVACSSAPAADVATLVAELRAILEPLLAASGEGEETW